MLSAVRYYPTLLRMNTLLRVSASNAKHEFNSLYSHFTLDTYSVPRSEILFICYEDRISV